jgi:hypothetical protein
MGDILKFLYDQQEIFALVIVFGVFFASHYIYTKNRRKWRKTLKRGMRSFRGKKMTRKERIEKDKRIQGDAIFDALDNLVATGQQTRYSVNNTLRKLANILNMPDFVSAKNLDMSQLTGEEFELIQGILRSKKELQKLVFAKKKVRIPGPKPGEVDNVTVFARVKRLAEDGIPKSKFGGPLLNKKSATS